MKYRIYLDTFFLINFYMDYIILWTVSKVLKYQSTHLFKRRVLGSLAGALWACFVIAFNLNGIIFRLVSYVGIVVLMNFILVGKQNARGMIKGTAFIYLTGCALGGALHVIYYYTFVGFFVNEGGTGILVVVGTTVFAPAIVKSVRSMERKIQINDTMTMVALENCGKKAEIQALIDTGNSLFDPIYGTPVNIVECEYIKEMAGQYGENAYHLIPYSSMGNESGLIPVVRMEKLTILNEKEKIEIEKPWVALYSGKLSASGEYHMILHTEMLNRHN